MNLLGATGQIGTSILSHYALLLTPFVSDGLTLVDPFLLIIFSTNIRNILLRKHRLIKVSGNKIVASSGRIQEVSMMPRSRVPEVGEPKREGN